jgi:hypothetical protein
VTIREQLAAEVARIQGVWARTPPIVGVARHEEIKLECRCETLRLSVMRGVLRRVNADGIGGAAAGHLAVIGSWSRVESGGGPPAFWLTVRMTYCEVPWDSVSPGAYATADFDALLAALEPGASPEPPPDRPETWHDRPGLL